MGSGMLSNTYDKDVAEGNAMECEKIADDYAIEFLEWFDKNCYARGENSFLLWANDDEPLTLKELLEIFKKEKGL